MRRLWQHYNLGFILAVLFLASWAFQAWTGWEGFQAEQQAHGEDAAVFGEGGYIWRFGEGTFENWQSEFLQLLSFVALTSVFIFRRSPESRDGQDEMQAAIERIEKALAAMQDNSTRRAG